MTNEEFQKHFSELIHFRENPYHPLVWINGEPEIGKDVYIGGMSEVYAKGAHVVIGDACDIASFVVINCADSHRRCIGLSDENCRQDITLEDHVFVGTQSVIGGGVNIGHHSVVGAGTVVPKGVYPPFSLIVGNPAVVKPGYYKSNSQPETDVKKIPHNKPCLGEKESAAAAAVIKSGFLAQGKEVEAFENAMCEFLGLDAGHAVAVSSGTAALYMALRAKEATNPLHDVAIPAYSCSALRNAVLMAGKEPVYLDTAPDSPNIDPETPKGKNASAIIACHMYGMPIPLQNSSVIEDCAQSIGATVDGKPVGSQTECGVFSFYATKPITSAGEGGMLVFRDKSAAEYIKDLRDFDQKNDQKLRFNFQMTDLQAAVGRIQLSSLPQFLRRRKEIAEKYIAAGIPLWQPVPGGNWYRALVKSNHPARLVDFLDKNHIAAILPIEEREILCAEKEAPNAWHLARTLVSLPMYPSLTEEMQNRILRSLQEYKEEYGTL